MLRNKAQVTRSVSQKIGNFHLKCLYLDFHYLFKKKGLYIIWRPPSLSDLTPY